MILSNPVYLQEDTLPHIFFSDLQHNHGLRLATLTRKDVAFLVDIYMYMVISLKNFIHLANRGHFDNMYVSVLYIYRLII